MRESRNFLSDALHLLLQQGDRETRSKAYHQYAERALERTTQLGGKNTEWQRALPVLTVRCKVI